jgi:hypothetical protein
MSSRWRPRSSTSSCGGSGTTIRMLLPTRDTTEPLRILPTGLEWP